MAFRKEKKIEKENKLNEWSKKEKKKTHTCTQTQLADIPHTQQYLTTTVDCIPFVQPLSKWMSQWVSKWTADSYMIRAFILWIMGLKICIYRYYSHAYVMFRQRNLIIHSVYLMCDHEFQALHHMYYTNKHTLDLCLLVCQQRVFSSHVPLSLSVTLVHSRHFSKPVQPFAMTLLSMH